MELLCTARCRHRRRRREDEIVVTGRTPLVGNMKPPTTSGSPQPESAGTNTRGAQFDLEATAFPPLPGLEVSSTVSTKISVNVDSAQSESSNSHWENR